MKTFNMRAVEYYHFTVEAETKEEAENKARQMWDDGELLLDADNFLEIDFIAEV